MVHMKSKEIYDRDYSFDNLRSILIFFVIFGHLLEVATPFFGSDFIYQTIYLFHMPLFLYLFGYFVKYNPQNIVFHWIVPYVVFQTLYIVFCRDVLHSDSTFQYTTPYWLLWYMIACIVYQCLLPIYNAYHGRSRILILGAVFGAALLVGFDDSVGYYLSLSRILVFQPWFLLGVYSRERKRNISKKTMCVVAVISGILSVLSSLFINEQQIPSSLLYGSYSYNGCGQTVWMRAVVMLIGFIWIIFLCTAARLMLNKKIPFVTHIGQNTLSIFLLHGFIVKAVPVFWPALVNSPWRVLSLSCLIWVVFGNQWAKKAVYCISLSWLKNFVPYGDRSL